MVTDEMLKNAVSVIEAVLISKVKPLLDGINSSYTMKTTFQDSIPTFKYISVSIDYDVEHKYFISTMKTDNLKAKIMEEFKTAGISEEIQPNIYVSIVNKNCITEINGIADFM